MKTVTVSRLSFVNGMLRVGAMEEDSQQILVSGHAVLDSVCSLSQLRDHCSSRLLYTPGDGDPHTIFLKFPSSLVSWLLGWKVG